jgi:hypothetical protein
LLNTLLGTLSSGVAAATGSYESIATATGTGTSATITFSSIPSTYKHLQIRWIARSTFATASAVNINTQINADTGANYANHRLSGDGSATTAAGAASATEMVFPFMVSGNSATAGIVGTGIIDIQDYASTTKTKTLRVFGGVDTNTSAGRVAIQSGLWNSTSAMTSISFTSNDGNFGTTTSFALYGIKG